MKFSVLMSIYHKEKPEYFNRAMQSIWEEQTVKPDEIILVQDGKLTDELYEVITKWQEKIGDIFKTIPLEQNVGTGNAKKIGLLKCEYELVAIMDTDDIAMPNRFKKQLEVFRNTNDIDVCGSWVSEFDIDENIIVSYRKLPQYHKNILKFAKKRCPINHPTVMYKNSAVISAGSYPKRTWFEDYYLWARMLLNGAKFYNIQEPLVKMRAGYGQLERRSGLKYALSELEFQKTLYKIGFLNWFEFLQNSIIRFGVRVVPKRVVKKIYKLLRS